MLCDAYNKNKTDTVKANVISSKGYDWSIFNNGLLNIIPLNNGENYWISSPSDYYRDYLIITVRARENRLSNGFYRDSDKGFIPVICLKSDVELKINYTEDEKAIESYSIE